ncbi:hypothetical protein ACFX2A_037090 [Malus domestica]
MNILRKPNPCLQSRANFRSFGHILDLPCILSQVLRGEAHLKFTGRTREEADSNGMVKCLKSDIEKFHHHKDHDHDHHDDYCLEITQAATSLPTTADHHMLFKNIARKVFPPESCRREGDEGWEPANRWGYRAEYKRKQLAAANEIDPGDAALLPHDILRPRLGLR